MGYVLPVQFLSFTGKQYSNTVLLNWTIIADKEVDRFEIERSTDNSNYVKTVAVSGTVLLQVQQSFSAADDITNIYSDAVYYRLKVIDKDGAVQYSNILVMRIPQVKKVISVTPNPAKDNLFIKFYAASEMEISIRLINNDGKIMMLKKQKAIKGDNNIEVNNLSRFSSGFYRLQVYIGKEMYSEKLILSN